MHVDQGQLTEAAEPIRTSRAWGPLGGLLALNGVLLLLLTAVTFAPAADAQTSRLRGEYTMVAGSVPGSDSDAVYIVDVVNQELIAMTYDHNTNEMIGVGYRHLAVDAAEAVRGRTRTGN